MKLKMIRVAVLVLAVILAMSMVGGTLAYFTQEIWTVNEYQLSKYSTEITERFESPESWNPGQEVNKDVTITNSGDVPVFVKVTLEQDWIRLKDVFDGEGNPVSPRQGEAFPLTFTTEDGEEYASLIQWGSDVVLYSAEAGEPDPSQLSASLGDGVVFSTLSSPTSAYSASPLAAGLGSGLKRISNIQDAQGKWLLMSETPDENGILTLYYIGVLNGNSSTPLMIDAVRMNPKIQNTTIESTTVWEEENNRWVTTTTENPTYDYQNARYTLTVNMYTVQATSAALEEMFRSSKVSEQRVISYMETFSHDPDYSRDDSVTQKLLYINERDGKLSYTPATGTENWFMSHLNMLPGESYTDTLNIENRSNKAVKLYMQVVPRDQEEIPDVLLDYIHMKVYHGTELIYDGTAKGEKFESSINNLQDLISLGRYDGGAKKDIRVELTLDKDTPIEFAGHLSKIDWRFVIEEIDTPSTPTRPSTPSGSPRTGDDTDNGPFILMMCAAGVLFVGCVIFLVVTKPKREKN